MSAIVDAYGSYYENNRTQFFDPDVTLAAMDLSKTDDVLRAFDALLSAMDRGIGEGQYALLNRARSRTKAFGLSAADTKEEAYDLATSMGGVCHPAHVDRPSNGLIAILGDVPEHPAYRFAEFNDPANIEPYREKYPRLRDMQVIYGSDAHRPDAVPEEAVFSIEVDDEGTPAEAVFRNLKGE